MVYILRSEVTRHYYVGITQDINDRFIRHNQGRSKATKHGVPWKLIAQFEVSTRSEAMLLEKRIKSQGAERFLQRSGS